jgi:hypothetical protein
MKKLYLYFSIIISVIVIFNIVRASGIRIKILKEYDKFAESHLASGQMSQPDTGKIVFYIPSVKSGKNSWQSTVITNWLANNCVDKCNDSISSGYKFSGKINNPEKGLSIKVTIKTDKEYAQPVRFDPVSGKFNGNIYFDKNNRMETPIKIMLRDSNNITLKTYTIILTE